MNTYDTTIRWFLFPWGVLLRPRSLAKWRQGAHTYRFAGLSGSALLQMFHLEVWHGNHRNLCFCCTWGKTWENIRNHSLLLLGNSFLCLSLCFIICYSLLDVPPLLFGMIPTNLTNSQRWFESPIDQQPVNHLNASSFCVPLLTWGILHESLALGKLCFHYRKIFLAV